MLKYLKIFLDYRLLLTIVAVLPAMNIIMMRVFGSPSQSSNGGIIVILAMNYLITGKKVVNDVIWVLPLKRSQLWMVFILRMLILTGGFILSNVITNFICKKTLFSFDNQGIIIFLMAIAISIYNIRTMILNFDRKSSKKFSHNPILVTFTLLFLTLLSLYPIILLYGIETFETYIWFALGINIIYPIAASYFITMKTKTLINFRVG